MVLPFNCSVREYFSYFCTCLNPILKLKPRELEVLSTLLMVYHSSKHLDEEKLYTLLYAKNTRKKMRESIGMSEASFNNHLSQLKKKRILTESGVIASLLTDNIPENGQMNITYQINVRQPTQQEFQENSQRNISEIQSS